MKLIIAIVRPESLESVKEELYKKDVRMLTILDVQGHGRQMGHTEIYRGREYTVDFLNKVEIQIAVNDNFVDIAVDALVAGARSAGEGAIGDGKIFVMPLERVVRIRTGEENELAL